MLQKTTKNYKKLQKIIGKTKFSKNGPKKITVYFKIKTTLKLISYHAKKQFPDPKLPTNHTTVWGNCKYDKVYYI